MITYNPEKDIVLEKVLDEYVLIRLQTEGRKHSRTVQINETGAVIWKLLTDGKDPESVLMKLSQTFEGVEKDTLKADIEVFLESLCFAGYLRKNTSGTDPVMNNTEE